MPRKLQRQRVPTTRPVLWRGAPMNRRFDGLATHRSLLLERTSTGTGNYRVIMSCFSLRAGRRSAGISRRLLGRPQTSSDPLQQRVGRGRGRRRSRLTRSRDSLSVIPLPGRRSDAARRTPGPRCQSVVPGGEAEVVRMVVLGDWEHGLELRRAHEQPCWLACGPWNNRSDVGIALPAEGFSQHRRSECEESRASAASS